MNSTCSFVCRCRRALFSCGLGLALAIAVVAPLRAQMVGFTDVFAVENWVFTSGGTGSSVTWGAGNTSFTLTASQLFNDSTTLTYFRVDNLASNYRISFDWSFTSHDPGGPIFDPAGFNSTQLSNNSNGATQSGSVSDAFVSSVLQFYAASDNWNDPSDATSVLTISNFSFRIADEGDTGDGGGGGGGYTPPAGTVVWDGAFGDWTETSNWNPSAPDSTLQANITGNATVVLTTTAEAESVYVDNSTLIIAGNGALTTTTGIAIDYGASFNVSGANASWSGTYLQVYTGNATFDDSATVTTQAVRLAFYDDNIAVATVRNGATWNAGDVIIGWAGEGTLNVESGAHFTATDLLVGYYSGSTGTLNVSGAGTVVDANFLKIGDFSAGNMTISDGAVVNSNSAAIAYGSLSGAGDIVGNVTVTGTGSQWNITENLGISDYSSATEYNLGTLTIADGGHVRVGATGTGTVTLERGGTLNIGNGAAAGTLQAGEVAFSYPSGTVYPVLAFNHTGETTFSALISGRGRVTKSGSGTTILTANNTYTAGGTVINAGTLQLGAGGTTGTVAGNVSVASGASLAFNRSNAQTFSGTISGDGSVVQRGSNTLTLSGSNTYTGGTRIESGTLRGTSGGNFGTGAITLAGGNLTLASNTAANFARNVVVSANGTITSDRNTTTGAGVTHTLGTLSIGAHTLTTARGSSATSGTGGITFGATTLTGNATFALGNNTALTLGAIGDGGEGYGFTKTGSSTLTLTGDNTYTGTTTISAGTLQLGNGGSAGTIAGDIVNNGTFTVNRTGSSTLTSNLSGSGSFTKTGSGTLTLAGTNSYTGSTTVSGGTLVVTANNALGTAANGTSVGSGAFLELQGGVNYSTAESLSLSTSTSGGFTSTSGENTWAGNVAISGQSRIFVSNGSQLNLTGVVSGSSNFSLNSGGVLALSNASNSFFGAVNVTGGSTLIATANGALGNTAGQINVNSGTLAFSGGIDYSSAKPITLVGNGATGRNGAIDNISGNNTFAGNIILSDATTSIGAATGTRLSLTGTISQQIAGWGPTFAGPGTIAVSGSNSYTGATTVTGGTLEFSALNNLGAGTAVVLNGGTLRYASGNTADLSARTVTIGANGGTIDTGTNNVSFANAIGNSGTGAFTKLGSGTLTFGGVNTYSGGTNLNAGTLSIAANSGLGSASSAVAFNGGTLHTSASFTASRATTLGANGGSFNTASGTTLTWNGDISGGGVLNKLGTGTLQLGGNNSYSGATNVNAGTLRLGSATALSPNTTLNVATGATFDANGFQQTFTSLTGSGTVDTGSAGMTIQTSSGSSAPNVFEGTLAGSGGLTVDGTGTLTITSTGNTYTGETNVTGGTLIVSGDISSSSQTIVTGTGVLAGTGTVGTVTIGSGGWLSPGNSPGTLNTGSATMAGGGNYLWEINDAAGAIGTNWDFVNVTGTLNITATIENPFTISVTSLTPGNVAGELFNFNSAQNYSYTIATASSGIFGFNSSLFAINTSGFANSLDGGVWSIAQSGNNLNLVFTAIPEPGTYAALLGALALLVAARRRRQHA